MARGKNYKHSKGRKHSQFHKFKNVKNKKNNSKFRDIKHTEQFTKNKSKLENVHTKSAEAVESDSEEELVEDPFNLLLSTFKNDNALLNNFAVDSENSSDESVAENDIGNYDAEIHRNKNNEETQNEKCDQTNIENETEGEIEEGNSDGDDSDLNEEINFEDTKNIEAEVNNKNDPFHIHFNYDLSESLLESVSAHPMIIKTSRLYWPCLHNLKVEIPLGSEQVKPMEKETETIDDFVEYAIERDPPVRFENIDYDKMYIKSQIRKNICNANEKYCGASNQSFTGLQKELFSVMNNYQDFFYTERRLDTGEEIRFIYCLHIVNHVLKTRLKILHHNSKLFKTSVEMMSDEFRDQGLVRPKVIIVVPFRDSCLRVVNMICSILMSENTGSVTNKKRFMEEFSGSELIMPKKKPKPEDYEQLFKGNIDDNFRIGLSLTKKSVKLYTDFYSSDIIIGSPLGLRMIIGAEGDKDRNFDFLASTEILVLDQAEMFLMQNIDHLLLIFDHLHVQPKESHGTDFSRVRSWALNGWTKFYRQTLMFSSIESSELNSIYNRRCFNYAGKVRTVNPVEDGSICRVVVPLSHVYQKFQTNSPTTALDERFQLFVEKIIPQYKDTVMTGVLIYVPSYFDYVRIRNYLKQNDYNFVQICEYSKDAKVARARDMFFHNEARILLYSERFHFFRRITLKGIRHVVFYQPPTFPHFYSEICNLMQEGNQNRFLSKDFMKTVSLLFCKYDIHQLSAIVKTTRATKMIKSEKNVFLFSTG